MIIVSVQYEMTVAQHQVFKQASDKKNKLTFSDISK